MAGLYYFTRNAFALKGENMKIIIVGCGKVGTALTAQLSREDNNVTVIDTDSIVVRNVSNLRRYGNCRKRSKLSGASGGGY